jgi:glycerol-3-phosphate dehydrogenase
VDNLNALVTVIGGKYTTSRQLGKDVVDKIATYFSHVRPQSRTDEFPLAGGDTGEIEDYVQEELKHNHYGLSNEVLEYQIRNYGTRYKEVLGPGEADKKMFNLIVPEQKEIWAQVDYAVNKEMARRLTDVVFRRTGLATTRDPGRDVIEKVATYMGQKLHWDKKRLQQEVNNYYDEIAIDDGE